VIVSAVRTLTLVAAFAGVARAQPSTVPAGPAPAVEEASEANLESTERRRGVTFTATAGPGLVAGFGIESAVGRGGSLTLRLGHVATRRTVITFELAATAVLHKPTMESDVETDTNTNLAAGAQRYVNPSLWLRLGSGVGFYRRREVVQLEQVVTRRLFGPILVGGLGFDLLRFRWAVLGIELATSMMINRDGVLVVGGVNLGLSLD
jgi:hypothetical protein